MQAGGRLDDELRELFAVTKGFTAFSPIDRCDLVSDDFDVEVEFLSPNHSHDRERRPGHGFPWGRHGNDPVSRRPGVQPIFAFQRTAGFWRRLLGRGSRQRVE